MQTNLFAAKSAFSNLLIYGLAHAMVDAVCAGAIFSILTYGLVGMPYFFNLVILYGVLAFGMQPILGLIVDHLRSPRLSAVVGILLTGISATIFAFSPFLAVVLAGLGNALFHLGGGTISLNLTPQKASAPGLYVAPGAMGLFVGTILGKSGKFVAWQFLIILFILAVLIVRLPKVEIDYERQEQELDRLEYFRMIFIFLFMTVAIRSLVGFVLVFPWKSNLDLAMTMTLGVVLGKALGGIFADKFGWAKIGVGATLLSIPLLILGSGIYYLAIPGILLFNMTMPITLAALARIFPGRPAFAFGLTCLALIIGSIPVFAGYKYFFSDSFLVFAIILASASFLYCGLWMLLHDEFFAKNLIKKQI